MLQEQFKNNSEKILKLREVYDGLLKSESNINKYHVKFFSQFLEELIIKEKLNEFMYIKKVIKKYVDQKLKKMENKKYQKKKNIYLNFIVAYSNFLICFLNKKKIIKNSFTFLQDNFEHMQTHIKAKINNLNEYKEQIKSQKKFVKTETDAHVVYNIQQEKIKNFQDQVNDDMYEYAKHKAERIQIISEQINHIHFLYDLKLQENSYVVNKTQLTDSFVYQITNDKNICAKVTDSKFMKALDNMGVKSLRQSQSVIPGKQQNQHSLNKTELLSKKEEHCNTIYIQRKDYIFIIFQHSLFKRKFQIYEFNNNLKPVLYFYFIFSGFFNKKSNANQFLQQFQFVSNTLSIKQDFSFVKKLDQILKDLFKDSSTLNYDTYISKLQEKNYFKTMKNFDKQNLSKKQIDYYFLFILNYKLQRSDSLDFAKQCCYILFFYFGSYYLSKYYDVGSKRQIFQIFESDKFQETSQKFYDFFEEIISKEGTLNSKDKIILEQFINYVIDCYTKIDTNFKFPLTLNFLEGFFEEYINKYLNQQSLIKNIDFLRNLYQNIEFCLDLEESTFFLTFFKILYYRKFKIMLDNNNTTVDNLNFQLLKFLQTFFTINIKDKKKTVNLIIVQQIIEDTELTLTQSQNLFRTDQKFQLLLYLYQITFQFKETDKDQKEDEFLRAFSNNLGKIVFDKETKIKILNNQTSMNNYYRNIKEVQQDFIRWFDNFLQIMNPELLKFAKTNNIRTNHLFQYLNESFLKGLFHNFLQLFQEKDIQTIEEINQLVYLVSHFFQIEKLFKENSFQIGFVKQMFLPYLKKWLKRFFQNLNQLEVNLEKQSVNESMLDSQIGLYKFSRDFLALLFTYADSLKQILFQSAQKDLNDVFFQEFSCILKRFLEKKLSLKELKLDLQPFYMYKRHQLKDICNSQQSHQYLNSINEQIIKNTQQLNNYDFVITKLKEDQFYKQILFSEISEKSLNDQLEEWIGFQVEVLSNCIYLVYFKFNILQQIYNENGNLTISNIKQQKRQSELVIQEYQNVMDIIKTKTTKDYTKQIKSEIFRPLLNTFIIKLSYIYYEHRSIILKQNLQQILEEDIKILLDYFKDVQQDHYNKNLSRSFYDFQKYLFQIKNFDDSKDPLIHFAYKLKQKKDFRRRFLKKFEQFQFTIIQRQIFIF